MKCVIAILTVNVMGFDSKICNGDSDSESDWDSNSGYDGIQTVNVMGF